MWFSRVSLAVILAASCLVPVHAQVATGNIRGTVTDTTEGVIPKVTITLINASTGLRRVVTTNEQGDFNAPSMPLGDYQVAAEIAGFQRKVLTGT